jgi:type IV secretory pathway TrbF-like protein/sugar phosphate permease
VRQARAIILVFVPFVLGFYLSYLFRTITALIADQLASDLALTAADLGLLTSVYFLSFAVMQLPVGVWLDRYGPRRVQSILLGMAALGAALFAVAEQFFVLVLGRALVGLGVAGALMAGLKAIVLWFPKERVALINGWFVTIGGLGAVTATAPAEWLLPLIDWRGLFLGLAPVTALCAVAIIVVVPESPATHKLPAAAQSAGLKAIYSDPRFWRLAPLSAICVGTSWAMPGLWVASWLTDVESLDRDAVVRHLLVMAIALCVGALGLGIAADRLRRRGVSTETILAITTIVFIAAQFALVLRLPLPSYLLWSVVAGVGAATVLSYAILAQYVPKEMTGRANGALNVFHFGMAFIVQWAVGLIVQQWPSQDGHYPAMAYQVALAIILIVQVVALLWFIRPHGLALWRVLKLSIGSRLAATDADRFIPVTTQAKPGRGHNSLAITVHGQITNWRLAALGSALLCGLLSLSLGIQVGRAGAVAHPGEHFGVRGSRPSDSEIAYFLTGFVENIRSLSSDPVVVHRNWRNAYTNVTGPAAQTVDDYAREVRPLAMMGVRTISVEITSVERISNRTFAVRWIETFQANGLRMTTEEFTGVFAIVLAPPNGSEVLIANPHGVQIDAIEWSGRVKLVQRSLSP